MRTMYLYMYFLQIPFQGIAMDRAFGSAKQDFLVNENLPKRREEVTTFLYTQAHNDKSFLSFLPQDILPLICNYVLCHHEINWLRKKEPYSLKVAIEQNIPVVDQLLSILFNPREMPPGEGTPLFYAVQCQNIDAVKTLLEVKAGEDECGTMPRNPNEPYFFLHMNSSSRKASPLHAGAAGDNSIILTLLIHHNQWPINGKDCWYKTPLYYAVINRKYTNVALLLQYGANVNMHYALPDYLRQICPEKKCSVLHAAAYIGDIKLIRMLCESGAECDSEDFFQSPLLLSIYNNHLQVVTCLVEYGADCNISYEFIDEESLHSYPLQLKKKGEQNKRCFSRFNTPLQLAARMKFNRAVFYLLSRGSIDFSILNNKQVLIIALTLLIIYKKEQFKCGRESRLYVENIDDELLVIRNLLQAGAPVNFLDEDDDGATTTPLHLAACSNELEAVRLLLEFGADPEFGPQGIDAPENITTNEDIKRVIQASRKKKQNRGCLVQ